ncbi:hypothetical protein Tco_0202426, partial [Tanacetum coccineum]
SLAEHKSHEEQVARENVALVDEYLAVEEIEKLVEDPENVDDSSPLEEETTKVTEVEPDIVIPVNVDDEEDEITDEVFESRRRAKGKNLEEPGPSTLVSQHIMEEISLTIDEAKLKKMADEMLRQRCTLGD